VYRSAFFASLLGVTFSALAADNAKPSTDTSDVMEIRHQTWKQDLTGHAPGLKWPLAAHTQVTSPFGERIHPIEGVPKKHTGVDLSAALGQPIKAAAPGRVVSAGWRGGYGYQVEVLHAGGLRTRYSHLSALLVEPGAMVQAGSAVGLAGATGKATGVHLHFEVWRRGRAKNPMGWFRRHRRVRRHQYVARPPPPVVVSTVKGSS
jgi:murein DD-endopeptidase MepM/ murein hydrolase activator NlpD